jgi:sigma-B regulation protein RsbU (phosphoserine phosphatase)
MAELEGEPASAIDDTDRLLLVDDSALYLKVLSKTLEGRGYELLTARSGEEALEVASASPPDLVLLDITMPGIDGFETCRRFKASERLREAAVIFMSSLDETADKVRGLELGAVDYITKPFQAAEVIARVNTHLTIRRLNRQLQDNNLELLRMKEQLAQANARMALDLSVGHEIQMSMLPPTSSPFPDRDEFSVCASLKPAREVGGDFFDYFFVDDRRLCLCVGDVSDKGVGAALFMAVTKTLIKAHASVGTPTADITTRVNEELCAGNEKSMFVTLFLGILDTRNGQMHYTNAGHNPPYLKRANGQLEVLNQRHGPVVGGIAGLTYKSDEVRLSKGDLLLLYTDGVTEAMDSDGKLFTEARLEAFLNSRAFENETAVIGSLLSEVKTFEGEAEQADDMTVLALAFRKDVAST